MLQRESVRIGNFRWITPALTLAGVVSTATLVGVTFCWFQSLSAEDRLPWSTTFLATVVGVPVALTAAYYGATQYVLWVEIGEDLTFASLVGSQSVAWDDVEGIELLADERTIALPVVPLELVVGLKWIAAISLRSGRQLSGYVNHSDIEAIARLFVDQPRLNIHCLQALLTPRSMMKTFVDAVMEGNMYFVSKFLDLSSVPEPRAEIAPIVAQTLKEVIDSIWYIDYEEIPDDPQAPSPYHVGTGTDQEVDADMLPLLHRIKIFREPRSGYWKFHPDTVAMIVDGFLRPKAAP